MTMPTLTFLVLAVTLVFVVLVPVFLLARYYVHVPSGHALVVGTGSGTKVSFSSTLVLPVLQRSELMDISVQRIHITRQGREGLVCKDSIRADGSFDFFVRVNHTEDDVLLVANSIGAARATRPESVRELFESKLVEALKTVFHQYDFDELAGRVEEIKDRLLQVIGRDLNGYVLDDLQLVELGQTPVDALDPNDVVDAAGIRAITERTSKLAIEKAELECESKKASAQHEIELQELLIEIERRRGDALAQLRATTGQALTVEQLEARLHDRIREVVDVAIAEKLARSSATPRGASS